MAASTIIKINDDSALKLLVDLAGYEAPAAFAGITSTEVHITAACGKTLDNGHTAASYLGYTLAKGRGRAFRFEYTDTAVYVLDLFDDEIDAVKLIAV
jgi:hypothetical protein